MPVMILCGGRGTRLRDVTEVLPKPMVPIGEQPIIWHIMKSFAAFGVRRFILCLGYKQESFIDYFTNFHLRTTDATIRIGQYTDATFHDKMEEADWQVTLAHTGLDAKTGLRIARASKYLLPEDEDFFLTYGDGVSDVNLAELYDFHNTNNAMMSVTAVHPPARFGEMKLEGDNVVGFDEKITRPKTYINGGFMAVKRDFIKRYLSIERDEFLEQSPISQCIADKQMRAFRHEGFWQCMDTPREYTLLNELWQTGNAPWTRYWKCN